MALLQPDSHSSANPFRKRSRCGRSGIPRFYVEGRDGTDDTRNSLRWINGQYQFILGNDVVEERSYPPLNE